MPKGKSGGAFASRIVGEGEEAPGALLANPQNWRRHPKEQRDALRAMLRGVGWVQRVIVNRTTGHLVDGHLRVEVAAEDNEPSVPVIYVELTETEERAVLAAIDPIGGMAQTDQAHLDQLLEGLVTGDDGLDAFLASLRSEEIPAEGLTDPDDVPEAQADPVTKAGDVWVMGKHRVMCGDSTSLEALEKLTGGGVDMWLTDPPYNVAYEGKTKDALKIQNDSMSDASFRQFLRDAYVAADAVMKAGAVFYIWHADSEGYNFRGAARDAGWKVRQCLIWKKQTLVMGRQDYHWKHEPCLYGIKDDGLDDASDGEHAPCLYGWKDGARHLWASDRKQTTILEFDRPSRSSEHPTMKPVALFEYQMLNNTKGSDKVLDSFGGSGTTLIAAEKNGRVACLMELDPIYCDVIVRRWQAFTGKQATLDADGVLFDDLTAQAVAA